MKIMQRIKKRRNSTESQYVSIYNTIVELIINITNIRLNPNKIRPEDSLLKGRLHMNSISVLLLLEELEKKYKIVFREDEFVNVGIFRTIGSLSEYVAQKVNYTDE